ncbi:MAG: DUF1570 domain-containing protein [Pirellula sp.]
MKNLVHVAAHVLFAVALSWCIFPQSQIRGDFVLYTIPGSDRTIVLEGKTKVIPGGNVEFTHRNFGSVVFSLADAVVVKAPARNEHVRKLRTDAIKSLSAERFLEAAREALRCGLLKECRECCDDASRIDPNHKIVQAIVEARNRIAKPIGDPKDSEARMRESTGLAKLRTAVSPHYIMLHDTANIRSGKDRHTRAESRLELLETIFESYFLKFALHGVQLETPNQRLMVILFSEEQSFQRYSAAVDTRLAYAGGYWSPKDNISVFYDQGTTPSMKRMTETVDDLKKRKLQLRGTALSQEVALLSNAIELITKVAKEESDIEVVSHEAAHQLAGNSGIMPRDRITSRWAHEGLASFFETPSGAVWGGVGAVNQSRLMDHRIVTRDRSRTGIESIVSDRLFLEAKNQLEAVEAYGQAWALTYFLMNTRFEALMAYYKATNALPDDANGEVRLRAFQSVFGETRLLEPSFLEYMGKLKTNLERIRE